MTESKNPSSSGGASGRVLSTAQHALQALEIIAQHPKGIPIKALARHLVLVRESDLAYDLQEFSSGACCIAAPIRDGRNGLVATLGISVPARRFEAEQKQLVKVIRDLAAEASAELGPATAPPLRASEASRPSPGGGAGIA